MASPLMEAQLREHFRAKWGLWAALGAGCLVGVSGAYLMQRLSVRIDSSSIMFSNNNTNGGVSRELASLHSTLRELQQEIRQLQKATKKPLRSALRTPTVSFGDVESRPVDHDHEDETETVSVRSAFEAPPRHPDDGGSSSRNGRHPDYYDLMTPSSSTTEYFSAISSDDEFFDLPSEDESATPTLEFDPDLDGFDSRGDRTPTVCQEPPRRRRGHQEDNNLATRNMEYEEHASRLASEIQKLLPDAEPEEERQLRELFYKVDQYMEGSSGELQAKAHAVLEAKDDPPLSENPEFLWRLCKSTFLAAAVKGQESRDPSCKQELILKAVEYGQRALDANEKSSEAHKWYAMAIGSRGEFLGIKEKILDGFEFKKHIDRASELAPQDHTIQHLLGRFCYEVAELSWLERKMAAVLFADPPSSTMEEAKDHFLAAEKLKPDGWKENRQYIAKCYIQMGEIKTAVEWLEKASVLPINNPDDQLAQNDIEELMKQHKGSNR